MRSFVLLLAAAATVAVRAVSPEAVVADQLLSKRAALTEEAHDRLLSHKRRDARFADADTVYDHVARSFDDESASALEKRAVKCPKNYIYVASKKKCFKNKTSCKKKCPANPRNGVWYCNVGPSCGLECKYGLTPDPGKNACVNPKFSNNACGRIGNSCPYSYNGIGTRSCYDGKCKITCPSGYRLRSTKSGKHQFCSRS